jgi:hypothetical protein
MLTVVLTAVGVLVVVAFVVVVLWVRRISSDMDYPGAHGPGLSPEESDAIRLGTSLAGSSAFLGATELRCFGRDPSAFPFPIPDIAPPHMKGRAPISASVQTV